VRILYGLDHVPTDIAGLHARLPGVELGPAPLRLNTEPLPPDRFPADDTTASRMAAVERFLADAAGEYSRARHRFIAMYMAFIAAHLHRHDAVLAERLRPYDGLYAVGDWGFSALRPLPRAWLPVAERRVPVDFAFWDGRAVIAVVLGGAPDPALAASGVSVCGIGPEALLGDAEEIVGRFLPGSFWEGERLPMTPFRLG
jgi:hypothetical protein